jgi:hypothetical protein
MHPYANRSGRSGVRAFEIGPAFVRVRFVDGSLYRYDERVPGRELLTQMKALALAGLGLNSFISRSIGTRFAAKEQG